MYAYISKYNYIIFTYLVLLVFMPKIFKIFKYIYLGHCHRISCKLEDRLFKTSVYAINICYVCIDIRHPLIPDIMHQCNWCVCAVYSCVVLLLLEIGLNRTWCVGCTQPWTTRPINGHLSHTKYMLSNSRYAWCKYSWLSFLLTNKFKIQNVKQLQTFIIFI